MHFNGAYFKNQNASTKSVFLTLLIGLESVENHYLGLTLWEKKMYMENAYLISLLFCTCQHSCIFTYSNM